MILFLILWTALAFGALLLACETIHLLNRRTTPRPPRLPRTPRHWRLGVDAATGTDLRFQRAVRFRCDPKVKPLQPQL